MIFLLFLLTIDPRYHTLEEIADELDSINSNHPDITCIETIGYSTNDSLPLIAFKISDRASIEEDEPSVLFIGGHHAEEILGVEICMYMINDLVDQYGIDPVKTSWINDFQIWFVPLMNPEGHTIVMNAIDTTWRKNKRDNNHNGTFELNADGVDLNRNYNFYWSSGGTVDSSSEYYRGPYAFSENETQAIRDLALKHRFTFAITYHSARTGLTEIVYYPWNGNGKYSPDIMCIRNIANEIAHLIINDAGTGHYNAMVGYGLDGKARNWLYGVCGTFTYNIEVSTTTIQPGWMVDDICARNIVGAYFLFDRLRYSLLCGHITDEETGQPLSAEIIVKGHYDPDLPARTSDPQFGRYQHVLLPDTYEIEIRKPGYVSYINEDVEVNNNGMTVLDLSLKAIEKELNRGWGRSMIPLITPGIMHEMSIYIDDPGSFQVIKVIDVNGRTVKSFINPAMNRIYWNLRDQQEREVPNGVYYLVGQKAETFETAKFIIYR